VVIDPVERAVLADGFVLAKECRIYATESEHLRQSRRGVVLVEVDNRTAGR
jgi:hypothetical protein